MYCLHKQNPKQFYRDYTIDAKGKYIPALTYLVLNHKGMYSTPYTIGYKDTNAFYKIQDPATQNNNASGWGLWGGKNKSKRNKKQRKSRKHKKSRKQRK